MIDFMLLWGFADRLTNERTDICTSRVTFATEKQAEKLKYAKTKQLAKRHGMKMK